MDILYLVDRLENLISGSRHMPLMHQILLKEADVITIIDQMRTSIPEEVKQARRIIQEKERILAQANAEAKLIHARAQEEARRLVGDEPLLRMAEERAQEMMRRATEQAQTIVRRAEEHTEHLKIDADGYATETLRNLREHLSTIETEIGRTVLSIEKGLESLEGRPAIPQDLDYDDDAQDELAMDDFDQNQPPPPRPRRASLAADTMGAGPGYE